MPTYITTSGIASGEEILAADIKNPLDTLDDVIVAMLDGTEGFATLKVLGKTLFTSGAVTLSSGAIAKTKSLHIISPEGGASSDDLDQITGGTTNGEFLILTAATSKTITLRHGISNLRTANGQNIMFNEAQSIILTYWNSNWHVVGYNHTHTASEVSDFNSAVDTRLSTGGAFGDISGTAGEVLAARDLVYLKASDGKWWKMGRQLDGSNNAKVSAVRGIVTVGGTTDAAITVRVDGLVGGFTGLTAGNLVYVSDTDGLYTQTQPTFTSNAQRNQIIVGMAATTTQVKVERYPVLFKRRQATVANGAHTVYHYPDTETRRLVSVDGNGTFNVTTSIARTSDTLTTFTWSGGTLTYGEFMVTLP